MKRGSIADGLEKKINSKNKYPQKYLITAAQASFFESINPSGEVTLKKWGGQGNKAQLNEKLYDGLREFQDRNHVDKFEILPIRGLCNREDVLHESVQNLPELIISDRMYERMNSNASITDIRVPPQNVDPSTSRKHLTAKYGATLVFPHTKQRLCPVASSSSDYPRFIATTGAITSPNYNRANDRGDQATRDHRLGAIFVEVFNKEEFLLHFLTATKDGRFVHMGTQYDGHKKPEKIGTDALVLGDIHWGEQDSRVIAANYDQIRTLKPKKLILHDFFTGKSISHWNFDKPLYRAQQFANGELFLEEELRSDFKELVRLSRTMGKNDIYIPHANHHDFLTTYMNSGLYARQDLWNTGFCHRLAGRICSNNTSPDMYLKEALSMFGDIPRNVHLLGLDDKLNVQGYRLSSHGHIGVNGAKNLSIKGMDESIGKGIIGHKHTPEQFRDSMVVGTSSRQDLHYKAGSLSASMACSAAIYSNGKPQLLPIIGSRWK